MKRKIMLLVLCLSAVLAAGCTDSEIADTADALTQIGEDAADQVENLTDAENPYVLGVKNACPESYPSAAYGEAFEAFFAAPAWKHFTGENGEEVVEFTGRCTYRDAEVKAVLQFLYSEDGKAFTIEALSFNDIPQDMLTKSALLETIFETYSENSVDTSTADKEEENSVDTPTADKEEENSVDTPTADKEEENMEQPADAAEHEGSDETEPKADAGLQDLEALAGNYSRGTGPKCTLSIWSADEKCIFFAMGIGSSGYLAYVDMRDCTAEWVDQNTAVYTEEYENRHYSLTFTINEGGLTLSENEPYSEEFSLAGGYVSDSIAEDHCEFVFPEDNVFPISASDLEGKTAAECKIARNEIYARYGRRFNDEQLQGYFDTCSWYTGTTAPEDFS